MEVWFNHGAIEWWLEVVADDGYCGEPEVVATRNKLDPRVVAKFKDCTKSRHESFNGRLKKFKCLTTKFRHGVDYHKCVFEAVCVLVQFGMDFGSPLFDAYP